MQLQGFSYSAANTQARDTAARVNIQKLTMAVDAYSIKHNSVPPQTLQELLVQDEFGGPMLGQASDLIDPWGNQYQYNPAGARHKGERPDIWTVTPDGRTIGNWERNK